MSSMFRSIEEHSREISRKQDEHIANMYRKKYGESPYLSFMGEETRTLSPDAIRRLSKCTIDFPEPNFKSPDTIEGVFEVTINFDDIKIFDENGEEW